MIKLSFKRKHLFWLIGVIFFTLELTWMNSVHYTRDLSFERNSFSAEKSIDTYQEGIKPVLSGFSFQKYYKVIIPVNKDVDFQVEKRAFTHVFLAETWFKPIYFIVLFIHAP